jgi:hypothetical protein
MKPFELRAIRIDPKMQPMLTPKRKINPLEDKFE